MTIDSAKSIPAFYAGQSIFLTGSTGFLGKVVIEKLLRSCPDIREIFLLMRPKKGSSINERLEKILKLPLFEKLREERPSNFKKLVPISGDASKKELDISDADRQLLIERTTIIINIAGDVKFNNSLKYAIFVNTRSTRDICILAQNMKNLIALVHVSTSFAPSNEPFIDEKVYPPVANWRKMIEMAELLDEHTLNVFMAKCLDYTPNTYIFSKNLAESIIQDYSSALPTAIIRPSAVFSTFEEPITGWIDNVYGPIGIFIGGGKGIIRVAYLNKTVSENIVPVDIVIKAILVMSWKLGLTSFASNSTFVLNCTNQKCLTYEDDIKTLFQVAREVPLEGTVWTPHTILTANYTLFYVLTILLHILPAMFIDLILKFIGRQPMLVRLLRKVYVANCAVSYFSLDERKFSNTNSLALMSSIPPDNLDMFSFNYSYINIRDYFKCCALGIKKFVLHEDISRLDAVKAYNKRLFLFVRVVKTIVYIGMLWIIYKWSLSYLL